MIDLCYIPCGQLQNGCPLFLYPGSRQGELPVRTKKYPAPARYHANALLRYGRVF